MRIVIVGAGKTGMHLAAKLSKDNEVSLVDLREDRIELVRNMLPQVNAVEGDACDPVILEHVSVGSADAVVAATGDDEDNLVVAMLAKHFGDAIVYARVNHPSNEWLYDEAWGVNVAVSSSEVLYGLVEKDLSVGDLITVLNLDREGIAIEEYTLPEESIVAGKTLAQVELPASASVVAVVSEGGAARIARGDTVLNGGDQLLLLIESGADPAAVRAALGAAG